MVIGIFGSLIWSKILMELIFNPCGEFQFSKPNIATSHIKQLPNHLHEAGWTPFQIINPKEISRLAGNGGEE